MIQHYFTFLENTTTANKMVNNPLCIVCGYEFVRTLNKKVKCKECSRKEQKIYQKYYYENITKIKGR